MALLNNETDVSVLVDGLDHVEGIAWGLDGYCYAGGEAGQIYRIDVERGEAVQIADTGGFVLGVALDTRHNIYACDTVNRAVTKISSGGDVSAYTTGAPDEPFDTPNFPAFDAYGNLYVCDSGDWKSDNGRIYKVGRDVHGPGLYLNLQPGMVFAGAGIWCPNSATVGKIRGSIVAKPDMWTGIVNDDEFASAYTLETESLKRPPRGIAADHPLIDHLKLKSFAATTRFSEEDACAPDFIDVYANACAVAAPLSEFLTRAVGLDW